MDVVLLFCLLTYVEIINVKLISVHKSCLSILCWRFAYARKAENECLPYVVWACKYFLSNGGIQFQREYGVCYILFCFILETLGFVKYQLMLPRAGRARARVLEYHKESETKIRTQFCLRQHDLVRSRDTPTYRMRISGERRSPLLLFENAPGYYRLHREYLVSGRTTHQSDCIRFDLCFAVQIFTACSTLL
jgi:hypothetical protein